MTSDNRNLTVGSTLRPPQYITSPSGDFAFGFRALDSGLDSLFLLAVWFNLDDDGTAAADPAQQKAVVWYATDPGAGSAVTATAQSVFSVTLSQLLLADTSGGRNIWTNSNPGQPNGFTLVLLDSGNLQFLAAGDNSVVWESFGHPADTLLPGQSMGAGAILRSKRSDADFSSGRFGLFVQDDGNIVLYLMNLAAGGNADTSKAIYYLIKNGSLHDLTPPMANITAGYYQRAALDRDGIVRVHVRPRNSANASWTVADLFPTIGCGMLTHALDGFCGPNSYCVVSGADNRLDCACPTVYAFIDVKLRYMGCQPVFAPQSCDVVNSAAEFGITKLPNTTRTASPPYMVYPHTPEERCADMCVSDCFCVAALFESDANHCSKMASLTGYGQQGNVTAKALIKVRTSGPPTSPRRAPLLPLLGRGGFGEVYHGVAKSLHPPDIAVKKLVNSNEYSEREFANEVQSIGRIHHKNLVRMVGYCKEREQRMLVFEFMPGGSLRSFLFQTPRPPWSWRAEAALDIAKGIELLGDQQMDTTVTNVRGTRGYIAPEWFHSERRIDTKVDVYSFGVVLLEMICCRRCRDPVSGHGEDDSVTLFGWAGRLVKHRRVEVLLHSDDDAVEENLGRVERFARVAFMCIERNPLIRPTMHQVVQMLEGVVEVQALRDLPSSTYASPSVSMNSRASQV
ncbi:hypothetical protein E2562_026679 [Oryza meyeriana var. granulata]|uniref:non-specific serine/threonine protein kinase n=1 Tax=Oryza meyeriana var. granulata TaxID=110450 RepID=A0A6G1C0Y1_9ORYZ|nr:hypothetical protein E2562_026679 [Oryza meyeriana var. granulata]